MNEARGAANLAIKYGNETPAVHHASNLANSRREKGAGAGASLFGHLRKVSSVPFWLLFLLFYLLFNLSFALLAVLRVYDCCAFHVAYFFFFFEPSVDI